MIHRHRRYEGHRTHSDVRLEFHHALEHALATLWSLKGPLTHAGNAYRASPAGHRPDPGSWRCAVPGTPAGQDDNRENQDRGRRREPGKLTSEDWKVLAQAAKWSRANADVLVDTHWIGGDPAQMEVYGYASWTPRKDIVMLRNPDDRAREFALDVRIAFELPAGTPGSFTLVSPWAEDA